MSHVLNFINVDEINKEIEHWEWYNDGLWYDCKNDFNLSDGIEIKDPIAYSATERIIVAKLESGGTMIIRKVIK